MLPLGPIISNCGPHLLPLVPYVPFVQKQANNQEPNCLCLLLNGTTLSSFPINSTACSAAPSSLQLQVDISACSGVPLPSSAPVSQVSSGGHPQFCRSRFSYGHSDTKNKHYGTRIWPEQWPKVKDEWFDAGGCNGLHGTGTITKPCIVHHIDSAYSILP